MAIAKQMADSHEVELLFPIPVKYTKVFIVIVIKHIHRRSGSPLHTFDFHFSLKTLNPAVVPECVTIPLPQAQKLRTHNMHNAKVTTPKKTDMAIRSLRAMMKSAKCVAIG